MIFLQTQQQPQGPSFLANLILFGGIIVIFYFFMILPQQRRVKREKEFRNSLKKGDKVVTIGGIYGRITQVEEKTVTIEIDNNVKIMVEKEAVKALAQSSEKSS